MREPGAGASEMIMKDRFQMPAADDRVSVSAAETISIKTINKSSYRGSIGGLIGRLREDQGKTFRKIANELGSKLGRDITLASVYYWAEGGRPRENAGQVEFALQDMLASGDSIAGGAWCYPDELRQIMLKATEQYGVKEMARMTGIPATTLYSWLAGLHRAPRKKVNTFVQKVASAASGRKSDTA